MKSIKITVEVEKKLVLPYLDTEREDNWECIANSCILDCSCTECENCLFDIRNYKTLLEQQKGD